MAELKNTPLREFHQEMGAKMVPRSGWNLPLNFSEGAQDEHLYCREKAALFDFCADGRFRIAFEGAGKALEKHFFAGEGAFAPGKCCRTFLVDSEGNALAPCRAGMMAEDDFFLTVPFGSVDRAVALFAKEKLEYSDLSEYLCTIAVAGPRTLEVLEKCQVSADMLPAPGEIKLLEIDGLRAIVSYFDDFGEEGFEISFNADCADQIWDLFLETDIPWPAGLAAQETLALESIQTATDAAGAVDQLRAALQAQQALLSTDESALWQYIDNTEGRKQALVDLLERLALQLCRMETQQYYGSDELKTLLSPQIEFDPDEEHAKRAKLHAVDHDED